MSEQDRAGKPSLLHHELWAQVRGDAESSRQLGLEPGQILFDRETSRLGCIVEGAPDLLRAEWLRLARLFPQTGFWPLLTRFATRFTELRKLGERGWVEAGWEDPYRVCSNPFELGQLPDRADYGLCLDPAESKELLSELLGWEAHFELASATPQSERALDRLVAPLIEPEAMLLISCNRPSDVQLLLDFGVPNGDATPGMFAGLLASWEERFGVVPVCLDVNHTSFQCLFPPEDRLNAECLAEEVGIFADDSLMQGGISSERGYDPTLIGARCWEIWWD